jgi:hypothetical protein
MQLARFLSRSFGLKSAISLVLFAMFAMLYWVSVPSGFNTVRENRRFFDSDGEFITRQFKQGKTYTHQDHLLYHVLASFLYAHADHIPGLPQDPVVVHKLLSVFFGALGVTGLFVFGMLVTGSIAAALLAALFVAGSAGYWFFSATIDTYVPSLCCGIAALGMTLKWLDDHRIASGVIVGTSMGLSFLFRTDGFLLGSLGLVLLNMRKHFWSRVASVTLAGALVSVVGYALLAHYCYDVAFQDVPAWSRGHLDRREVGDQWGVMRNLTLENTALVLVNQTFYTVLLPGLEATTDPDVRRTMADLRYGQWSLAVYLLFLLVVLASSIRTFVRGVQTRQWTQSLLIIQGVLWFFSRTLFYTWWNPYEPFLFAVMSLPALWLLCLLFLREQTHSAFWLGLMTLIVILIWVHNLAHLILPLRALPV